MSERTPSLATIHGAGKPRLIIYGTPFYKSGVPCTYTSDTITLEGAPTLDPPLAAGQRVAAFVELGDVPPVLTDARIMEIDEANGIIRVDRWSHGIPASMPAAPVVSAGGSGLVEPGVRRYAVTFVVDGHETPLGLVSAPLVIFGGSRTVNLTAIPVRDEGTNGVCSARNIYRTGQDGGAFGLVAQLAGNTARSMTDNVPDAALGSPPSESVVPGFVVDGWIADLPRCQEITETFSPYTVVHQLYRGGAQAKLYGWQYRAKLDYGKYLSADALYDLHRQLQGAPDGTLVLIPRRDRPQLQYKVYYDEPLTLGRYGRSPGYRHAVLHFAGCELLSGLPMSAGYGAGYAMAYGRQL